MAKKKKDSSNSATNNAKSSKVNALLKILCLLLGCVIAYAVIRCISEVSEYFVNPLIYYVGTTVYAVFVGALFAAFYVLNGYTFDNRDREADELPARWSDEKKAEYLQKQPARRARAKKILYVLLPAAVAILVSIIENNYF